MALPEVVVRATVAQHRQAVQDLRDWKVVFGRYGDAFEARPLELGRSDGRHVEVLAGLQAGCAELEDVADAHPGFVERRA